MVNAAELKITIDAAGNLSVTGPIDQKLLCYGMLECAKDAVRTHAEKTAQRIVVPSPGDVLAIDGGKKNPRTS